VREWEEEAVGQAELRRGMILAVVGALVLLPGVEEGVGGRHGRA
jgi:hypothetical protein